MQYLRMYRYKEKRFSYLTILEAQTAWPQISEASCWLHDFMVNGAMNGRGGYEKETIY